MARMVPNFLILALSGAALFPAICCGSGGGIETGRFDVVIYGGTPAGVTRRSAAERHTPSLEVFDALISRSSPPVADARPVGALLELRGARSAPRCSSNHSRDYGRFVLCSARAPECPAALQSAVFSFPGPCPAMPPWNPLGQQYCPNLRPCQNSPLKASGLTQKMLDSPPVASSTTCRWCHATRGTRKADRAQWFCARPRGQNAPSPARICLAHNRPGSRQKAPHVNVIKRRRRRSDGRIAAPAGDAGSVFNKHGRRRRRSVHEGHVHSR